MTLTLEELEFYQSIYPWLKSPVWEHIDQHYGLKWQTYMPEAKRGNSPIKARLGFVQIVNSGHFFIDFRMYDRLLTSVRLEAQPGVEMDVLWAEALSAYRECMKEGGVVDQAIAAWEAEC